MYVFGIASSGKVWCVFVFPCLLEGLRQAALFLPLFFLFLKQGIFYHIAHSSILRDSTISARE